MKYSQANQGRIYVIRLEDGDIIHNEIEKFAQEEFINAAALIIVGGVDKGSKLVVGPEHGRSAPVVPVEHILNDVHEIVGTGTIFPNERGEPVLHMHTACGRQASTVTGCVRRGVKTWLTLEVVLFELIDADAIRAFDPATGFDLLNP